MKTTQCIVFATLTTTLVMSTVGCSPSSVGIHNTKAANDQPILSHPVLQRHASKSDTTACIAGATVVKVSQPQKAANDDPVVNQNSDVFSDNYADDNVQHPPMTEKEKHIQEMLLEGFITLAGKCIEFGHCGL